MTTYQDWTDEYDTRLRQSIAERLEAQGDPERCACGQRRWVEHVCPLVHRLSEEENG